MNATGRGILDAVVVGAGPAGSWLARSLARAGRDVLMIDRDRFPREKVCGGGLSTKTLGLLDGVDLDGVVHADIQGAFISYRNEATLVKDMRRRVGATVVRSEFDHMLATSAVQAGARFLPGTAFRSVREHPGGVTVETSAGTFEAQRLIAADGVGSAVRNAVFGRNLVRYAPAVEALLPLPASDIARYGGRVLFDLGGTQRGYGWIFPKRDHVNVGIYSIFGGAALRADLDRFIALYPSLARHGPIRRMGFAIPVRNVGGEYERGRVMLVGDAAGFAESVYGEGIYFALRSAAIAARALCEPDGCSYTGLVRRELAPELRYSEAIARLLFARPRLGFEALARNTIVNDYFAGLIFGDVGYRECFYKTLLTLPRWLFARRHQPVPGLGL